MSIPVVVKWVLIIVAVVVLFALVLPQRAVGQEPGAPVIRKVPVTRALVNSGADMYRSYCASCHGIDGKGKGPAAAAMKAPLPDLTQLTRRNGGKYPEMRVISAVLGDLTMPAHGSKDMPVWGVVFHELAPGSSTEPQLRVHNLVKYISQLQTM